MYHHSSLHTSSDLNFIQPSHHHKPTCFCHPLLQWQCHISCLFIHLAFPLAQNLDIQSCCVSTNAIMHCSCIFSPFLSLINQNSCAIFVLFCFNHLQLMHVCHKSSMDYCIFNLLESFVTGITAKIHSILVTIMYDAQGSFLCRWETNTIVLHVMEGILSYFIVVDFAKVFVLEKRRGMKKYWMHFISEYNGIVHRNPHLEVEPHKKWHVSCPIQNS